MLEALERREFLSAVTAVDSSGPHSVFGQPITLTAFVSDGGGGTVSFFDGDSLLGTAPLASNGQAKLRTASLAAGSHAITAAYDGSTSAPFVQSVSPARSLVTLDASSGVVRNPILRPDHVVVVVLENAASNAVGDVANMPYLNRVAAAGLVYDNSHGLNGSGQGFGQMNYLALYSGATQGITDDFSGYTFDSPNLAQSLHNAGLSFTGYAESLPAAGDMTTWFAPDPASPVHVDAYARRYNPFAQFANVGAGKTNADVNKPFSAFPTDYGSLSTVSYVIPNRLHNTHGSNEAPPFANDPTQYDRLRRDADSWLAANIDRYLQWAKANNSLLIITTEDGDRSRNYAGGGTTIVAGDPDLFVGGINSSYVTHYHVLRTIEDMYGLAPIGDTGSVTRVDTDPLGRLSPAGPMAGAIPAGHPVTYTATVSPLAPSTGTPGGTVQFLVDGSHFGGPVELSNGTAGVTLPGLSAGTHTITAVYGGSPGYVGNDASLAQPVGRVTGSVSLKTSAPSVTAGQTVVFTATVSGPAAGGLKPGGSVTFFNGTTSLGSAPVGASGVATLSTSALPAGTHSITAVYSGDANFAGGVSPAVTQQVVAPTPAPVTPANDKFASAARLSGVLATATGSNVGATREGGEPKHGSNGGGKSVWWSWTAPSSGVVTVDTLGSGFRTVVGVYTGTSVQKLKKVGGPSASLSNTGAFGFLARAGTTYHVAVDGANGATGNVQIRVKSWSGWRTPKGGWKDVFDLVQDREDEEEKGRKKGKD